MKFHQSLTISSSQDVVARFTFDSATEFLFGKDVESIAAGLPYPAESPLANHPNFVNHPSNLFIRAFSRGLELIAGRVQGGGTWPLLELWKDNVQPHREAVDRFIQPILTEALDNKSKGIKTESNEENMSLLDLLVKSTDGKSHPMRWCLAYDSIRRESDPRRACQYSSCRKRYCEHSFNH